MSLRDSKWLLCNNYALCIMNYALKGAHGCVPVTATRFDMVFLLTVGCASLYPRLGSVHHYVVLS